MHHRFLLVGSSLSSLTQRVETAEGRTRRLITLIFAGRHNAVVMVVIRRELPQTRLADWFEFRARPICPETGLGIGFATFDRGIGN